eukprot:scaffold45950_cov19-Tisochrysis_lutea.AAC.2
MHSPPSAHATSTRSACTALPSAHAMSSCHARSHQAPHSMSAWPACAPLQDSHSMRTHSLVS